MYGFFLLISQISYIIKHNGQVFYFRQVYNRCNVVRDQKSTTFATH